MDLNKTYWCYLAWNHYTNMLIWSRAPLSTRSLFRNASAALLCLDWIYRITTNIGYYTLYSSAILHKIHVSREHYIYVWLTTLCFNPLTEGWIDLNIELDLMEIHARLLMNQPHSPNSCTYLQETKQSSDIFCRLWKLPII